VLSDPVGVAVAQFAPIADTDANLRRIRRLSAQATARGARFVVFPEYAAYFVDPLDESLAEHSEPLDGPFTDALRAIARESGVTLVAGMAESADGGGVHNTAVAVSESGIVASYRKEHLYDAFGQRESRWIVPGDPAPPRLFDVDGLRCGILTCYDLRFPESARIVADAGADVIAIPAEWVRGPRKEDQWQTLLRARAIENALYVAAADQPPPLAVGLSAVIDPEGVVLAGVGTSEGVAVAAVDRVQLDRVRTRNPVLESRRYRVVPRDPPGRA
jgi:predicted amidohydrolase